MRWLSVHAIAEPVALCFVTVTKLLVLGRLIYFINRDGRALGSRWVMLWRYLVGFVVLGNAAGFCGSIAASVFFTRAADAMSSSSSRYRDQEVVRREGFSDITSGTRAASVFFAFETIILLVIVLAFSIVGVRSARIIREALTAVTTAIGLSVNIRNAPCANYIFDYGANSYGGSISALYVGAYAWSSCVLSFSGNKLRASNSSGGETTARDLVVSISNASCSYCRASTTSDGILSGANSYCGSMSALYVGARAWSNSDSGNSSSSCGETNASNLTVSISNSPCSNCSASTQNGRSRIFTSYGTQPTLSVGR
jgi:hypothetical protein